MANNNRNPPQGLPNNSNSPPRTPSPGRAYPPPPPSSPATRPVHSVTPQFSLTQEQFGRIRSPTNSTISTQPSSSNVPSAAASSDSSGDDTTKYPIPGNRYNETRWNIIRDYLLSRRAEPEVLIPSPEFMNAGRDNEPETSNSDPKGKGKAPDTSGSSYKGKGKAPDTSEPSYKGKGKEPAALRLLGPGPKVPPRPSQGQVLSFDLDLPRPPPLEPRHLLRLGPQARPRLLLQRLLVRRQLFQSHGANERFLVPSNWSD
ncbi:hypothetical protein QBC34DRAFT_440488 [Podospora aff. communis PSN243]|uniref:Uncharacterized protein n=1 Tax=Podospora aff. communis PSN243 TaxID=3040156 RepID=A0AAV9GJ10_9PEZI|nr:hypothetical protein QBC34DRAFT_440488 [Podospora aff. communis PSN243]